MFANFLPNILGTYDPSMEQCTYVQHIKVDTAHVRLGRYIPEARSQQHMHVT